MATRKPPKKPATKPKARKAAKAKPGESKRAPARSTARPASQHHHKGHARSTLDEKLGTENFCERVLNGESMAFIARMMDVSVGSLDAWVAADPERLARAREARMRASRTWDEMAEEVIRNAADAFQLAKARELAQHYRWRAKCVAPKLYGDKLDVEADVRTEIVRKVFRKDGGKDGQQ